MSPLLPSTLTRPVSRLGAAAQNALEVARFGGLATDEQPSPYEVAAEERVYKLRHYYPERAGARSPVVLVPPMMLAAEVYDVAPNSSAVTILSDHGVDPWVVDFGIPEREEGGLERTLADHVLAVYDAVDAVREATGHDVHLARLFAGRDVRLPGGRVSPQRRAQLGDHVRKPGRHASRDAVRNPGAVRLRRSRSCSPTRSAAGRYRRGPAAPGFGCSTR